MLRWRAGFHPVSQLYKLPCKSLVPPGLLRLASLAMSQLLAFVLTAVLTLRLVGAAPAALPASGSSTASAAAASETVLLASDLHNGIMWNTTTDTDPQPMRGELGGTILAQQNVPLQQQNPDILAPPTTDHNSMFVLSTVPLDFVLMFHLVRTSSGHLVSAPRV